jgi:hypothetical protein
MQCHLLHQYILDEDFYQKPIGQDRLIRKATLGEQSIGPGQLLKLLTRDGAKPSGYRWAGAED